MKNFVNVDTRFQKSINLTLDTGDMALVNRYIPTRSSVSILKQYLTNIVRGQGEHATILIGPYGKGKSHLLLVLLALLCKSKDETAEIQKKIIEADNSTKLLFMELAEVGRPFLPVIVSSFQGDLNESFIFALQEALKKTGIRDLPLPSEYSEAVRTMESWKESYHDSCNRYEKLQKQLDEHIDFAEKRKTQRFYKSEIQRFSKEKGEKEGRIEACKKRIETTEKEMQSLEARNERNRIWRQRLEIAEELYRQLYKEFSEQENKIFLELNRQIQENFSKMFNAKDKKIELTPKYEIQMLYRTQQGYREEKNLSEGEKIARNFAFIVTIMDFSRRKKQEKTGHETADSDTLPIVLDGPFSKLGDENIELIAKVLPQVSEQVIIFMLKKDWEYTKLDPYVGSRYYIDKKPEESFATIKPAGEETV